jgi:membrane protease YdiL (CAAX protease family)
MGGLAQVTYETSNVGGAAILLYVVAIYAILVIPYWVIFTKAGQPGWPALIPIYSTYILLRVVGRPGWWLILFIIPLVNFVILIIVMNDLSKSFGHGVGFTLGLIFLSIIFLFILAFGSSTYRGPAGASGASTTSPPPPMPV